MILGVGMFQGLPVFLYLLGSCRFKVCLCVCVDIGIGVNLQVNTLTINGSYDRCISEDSHMTVT